MMMMVMTVTWMMIC